MSAIADPSKRELMAAILATVEDAHGPDAAAWLAMHLGAQTEIRALRRAERDDVIREALEHLAFMPMTNAAERLSFLLDERLRTFHEGAPVPGTLDELVDKIARLNGFASLTGRSIYSIGKRT